MFNNLAGFILENSISLSYYKWSLFESFEKFWSLSCSAACDDQT